MSNLISNNQRSTAQVPEVEQPPIPKPPRRLQEYDLQQPFEQGFDPSNQLAGLEIATEEQLQTDYLQPGESVDFVAPQQGLESTVGLTDYFGDKLGSGGVQVQIPEAPSAFTPPMTNLWKDAAVDLGIPNLADQRLVSTANPRPYADPLTYGNQFGSTDTFVRGAAANAQADAQEQANRNAALAKVVQDFQNARGNLPNTPDASKPWHEQLWGWAGDVLQGTEQERAEENRTGKGTFGAYGSGLGGFFKSMFGVPIAAATATYLETWGRDEYNMQGRFLRAGNPTVRTERVTADGKRMSVEAPFNSLSAEEQHKYLTEVVSNRLPLGTGALVRTNVDFRKAFGSYIYDALAGNVNDSINEANPKLAPVIDKRTGKPAVAKPARGLLQSANLRPGQEWFEDGGGAALEIATQLFSPGNKVDAAGELLGLGFKLMARTNVAKATGRAIANAVPKPIKQAANLGKRTVQAVAQNNFGSRPLATVSQPTSVVAVQKQQNLLNNLQNTNANSSAPTRPIQKPPVVPNVPAFVPTATPLVQKTDPEGLAAVVGVGQKGQPLSFVPSVEVRSHDEFVESLRQQFPKNQLLFSYKGKSWDDWREWRAQNLGSEDFRQLEAVGSVRSFASSKEPTLADLQEQARLLAEQKLSVEAPMKQLEEIFDETVDAGRREIDELPLRPLTEADVQKATDYGASLRLSRQLPSSVVEAAARGNWKAVWTQAEALGGTPTLLQRHNTVFQDLDSVLEIVATTRLAPDVPTTVYHGTALENWSPDYSFSEFGSRGELGSGLYSTSSLEEAEYYARATVGNNRSVEIAYEPLAPQVVELDSSQLQATLDARLPLQKSDELVQAVVNNLPETVKQQLDSLNESLSFAELLAQTEVAAAKAGGGEEVLQRISNSTADALRELGYDSVYDKKSGWLNVVDNGKLQTTKATSLPEPTAVEAAVARYNADSVAAGHFPSNVTSDANLRDSTYQLLDTARNQLDEKLEEVQQQLTEATTKDEPIPTSVVAKAQTYDELRARVKEPPSEERYVRDIQEFGQPLHPVLVRELGYNGRIEAVEFEVIGNFEAYEAALKSYHPRDYSMVAAMVEGGNYSLIDIRAIRKKSFSPKAPAATKEEVLKEFNPKNPSFTTAPVVLEQTSFESFRVLDRGFTANAYSTLYKRGEQAAEMVPSMVVDKSGKADFKLVDLATIEKKPKPLEPPVPTFNSPGELLKYSKELGERLDALVATYEKRMTELGLNAPKLKRLALQHNISAEGLGGAYKSSMDAVLLEANYSDDLLAHTLAHEYSHVLENKLTNADLDEFRKFIDEEGKGVFPSEYSKTNKTEYMAEVMAAVFRGEELPPKVEEAFKRAWRNATEKTKDSPIQTEAKLTELFVVDEPPPTTTAPAKAAIDVDKLTYKELQKKAKELGLGGKGTKAELQKKLQNYYKQSKTLAEHTSNDLSPAKVDKFALDYKSLKTNNKGFVTEESARLSTNARVREQTTFEDLLELRKTFDLAQLADARNNIDYIPQEYFFAKGVTEEQLQKLKVYESAIDLSYDPPRTGVSGQEYPATFAVDFTAPNRSFSDDEMDALEMGLEGFGSFSEPVQPNPHANLREALDSTLDDSPNICKF